MSLFFMSASSLRQNSLPHHSRIFSDRLEASAFSLFQIMTLKSCLWALSAR